MAKRRTRTEAHPVDDRDHHAAHARNLARTDPVARLQDYNEALGFYLVSIDRRLHGIIFVENSDSDVTTAATVGCLSRVKRAG